MEKNDTVDGTISQINSGLKEMHATILLYDDPKHDSFNRLLTRIGQAIEDEQSAMKEIAASWIEGAQAEPVGYVEADERQTRQRDASIALEKLVG